MEAPVKNVYCRNFPKDFDNAKFNELFGSFGAVVRVYMAPDSSYAIIEYANAVSCQGAIANLHNMPPHNMFVSLGRRNREQYPHRQDHYKDRSMNEEPKMDNNVEEVIYCDKFNKIIEVLADENDQIFVPLSRVDGVKCLIKGTPKTGDELVSINGENYILLTGNGRQNAQEITDDYKASGDRFHKNGHTPQNRYNNQNRNSFPRNNYNNNFSNNRQANPKRRTTFETLNNAYRNSQDQSNTSWGGPRKFSNMPNNNIKIERSFTEQSPNTSQGKLRPLMNSTSPNQNRMRFDQAQGNDDDKSELPSPKPIHKNVTYPTEKLPEGEYTEVKVETVENESVGWVQKTSNIDFIYSEIEQQVLKDAEHAVKIEPQAGAMCLAKFEGVWLRAVILNTMPKIRVRFIDYGHEIENPIDGLRKISLPLSKILAQAIRIRLADGAPCKIKARCFLNVKPDQILKDEIVVQVENGIYEEVKKPAGPPAKVAETQLSQIVCDEKSLFFTIRKALFNFAEVDTVDVFEPKSKVSSRLFTGAVMPSKLSKALLDLDTLSRLCAPDAKFKPLVGEMAAGQYDDNGWCRCIILAVLDDQYKVAFIDWGITGLVKEVRPVAKEYTAIPQFACLCEVEENVLDLAMKKTEYAKVLTYQDNKQSVVLLDMGHEKVCLATLHLWGPETEFTQKPTPPIVKSAPIVESPPRAKPSPAPVKPKMEKFELQTGNKIQLIQEQDGYLYVRSKACHDLIKKIDDQLNVICPKAPSLVTKPSPKDLVAAQFDNCWYRAIVLGVNGNNADILYIDYGNEETIPFKTLKVLDDDLAAMPHTLIKIQLKGFVTKKFTLKALEYLGTLAENKTVLTAHLSHDGVDLLYKNGRSVCEELINLDTKMNMTLPNESLRSSPMASTPNETAVHATPKANTPIERVVHATPKASTPIETKTPRLTATINERIMFNRTSTREIIIDSPIDINIIDIHFLSEGEVFFAMNDADDLYEIYTELPKAINSIINLIPAKPYIPVAEELVLVYDNGKWQRATILETEPLLAYFVDNGTIMDVTLENLRPYPLELLKFPIIGELGRIKQFNHGGSADKPQVIKILTSVFGRKSVFKASVSHNGDKYTLDIPELKAELWKC